MQCLLIEKTRRWNTDKQRKLVFSDTVTCFATSKAARIGVICQGASSAPHFLLARLQGYSFQFVFQLVFPAYTLQLPSICVLPSWEFSLEQVGISPTYQVTYLLRGQMKVPHLMSVRPMEWRLATLNASSPTMSHALVTSKSCSNRSHLSGCFNCSSLLACKAPRIQLSICFPISLSRIHLTASLYLCPADRFQDIVFEQAGNSHWNKLAFLQHIK